MSRTKMRKIARRFSTLVVLVACLAVLLFGGAHKSRVQAVVCCSSCQETFEECYLNCGEPPVGQGFYQYNMCIDACARRYEDCQETCDSEC